MVPMASFYEEQDTTKILQVVVEVVVVVMLLTMNCPLRKDRKSVV